MFDMLVHMSLLNKLLVGEGAFFDGVVHSISNAMCISLLFSMAFFSVLLTVYMVFSTTPFDCE